MKSAKELPLPEIITNYAFKHRENPLQKRIFSLILGN